MIWFYLLLFILSCALLSYSGTWIVKSLIKIARFLNWKSFVISSILMGLSTSLPETFIGITSALHNESEIILGITIGSNIIALTIIVGIGAFLTNGIVLKKKIVQKSTTYAILYSLLPFLLILDGNISRSDGIILLASFGFYYFQLISQQKRFTRIFNKEETSWVNFKSFLSSILVFSAGIAVLLLSSEGIIFSALKITEILSVPDIIIGIFLIALGTSLPEIIFGIKSVHMKQKNMIMGNIMGSIVTNSTLAIGTAALISPIEIVNFSPYLNGIIFILITCIFFLIFAKTDHKITKKEASLLIFIYFVFILSQILFGY